MLWTGPTFLLLLPIYSLYYPFLMSLLLIPNTPGRLFSPVVTVQRTPTLFVLICAWARSGRSHHAKVSATVIVWAVLQV